MLNTLWTIRFELLLTAAALGIGALGLWHEYSAQRRIARMAQDFKDGGHRA